MAPAHRFDKGAEMECVYLPESDRGTLAYRARSAAAQLLILPYRHDAAGAQPDGGRDRRPGPRRRDRLGDFPGGVAPAGGLVPKGEGVRAVSNVVFMGMGEPLYNFEAVRDPMRF